MQFIFWLFLILIIYTYAGYPALIWIIGTIRPRAIMKKRIEPTLVILTSAYNEKDHIEATIRNKFEQDYPKDKLHYVVVSDASNDGTDDIVKKLQREYKNLHFIRQNERAGKTAALNMAVEFVRNTLITTNVDTNEHECSSKHRSASTDTDQANISGNSCLSIRGSSCILLFSDANSLYKPNAIRALIRNFADPTVGYVTGKMIYQTTTGSGVSEGCGAYMTYENRLREYETKAGSVIGVDGGIDACRLALYEEMDPEDLPDLVLPLSVMQKKYRVVYEPEAVIVEDANETHDEEFSMRVRVALRSIRALMKFKDLSFNVFKHGLISWQIISHKGFRYDVGWMQGIILVTNYFLIPASGFYHMFFTLQIIFYGLAGYGYIQNVRRGVLQYAPTNDARNNGIRGLNTIIRFAYYLCLVNTAACIAGIQWLRGRKQTTWEPRK
jgi:cellulose synthase/poly-beta-1,6-N-acetylglucosamine synthase-like glycosyltransferase